MELKAPAGNLRSALAALEEGADNVYVGLAEINHQRNQLQNLTPDEMRELCDVAHKGGQRVMVTLNSSATDDEWDALTKRIALLDDLGVDGTIVADLGVVEYLAKHHERMKILFSVQGECSNISFAQLLADVGVQRVVLERNVSIREAKRIKEVSGLEVELFVFGYSCNSQDSICYMGDYWSGSPCNVHCAQKVQFLDQPGLEDPKRYLFMQYYSALRYIPQLAEAGIDGLKIEGRQRSSDYVRKVTRAFRGAIDRYEDSKTSGRPFSIDGQWQKDLRSAAMAFDVTDGFFVVNDYHRTVLEDPSPETVVLYATDTARNLAEGQTSLEFLRRSFVRHVQRAFSKPELDPTTVRTIDGL